MRIGTPAIFAMALALAGCSAAERRADNTSGPPAENATTVENMTDGADATSDNVSNAVDAASGNASNGADAGTGGNTTTIRKLTRVNCPLLGGLATPEECEAIKAQVANLEAGVGAFNGPATMTVGKPETVAFAVGRKDEAADTAASVGGNVSTTLQVPTKVGRYMTASLGGDGFVIDPATPQPRDLGAGLSDSWSWQVTPKRAGKLSLILKVSVEAADEQGKRTPIKISSKTVAIDVGVRRIDKVKDFADDTTPLLKSWEGWFAALAGLVGAISLAYLAFRRFGKKKDDPPAPPKANDAKGNGSGEPPKP